MSIGFKSSLLLLVCILIAKFQDIKVLTNRILRIYWYVGVLHQTKYIQSLGKIDKLLWSSPDFHKVIRKVYREINKLLDTNNFYIAVYHREENILSFEIYNIEDKEITVDPIKLSKDLAEYVKRSKKIVCINNDIQKFFKRFDLKTTGKKAKSWLGVPIIYRNNFEGVIVIQDYKDVNVYTPEDESFLFSIATKIGVVIANTRLIQEGMRREKELLMLNQINRDLVRIPEIDIIYESIIKSISQNFKNLNVSIFLIEDEEIVLKKLSGGFKMEIPGSLRIKSGEGIIGTVAKTGKLIVANDVTMNSDYLAYGQTSTKSEIAIPLKISRKTIGVLNIECDELNVFNANSVMIFELIAGWLSTALHNLQLYNKVESLSLIDDLTKVANHRYFHLMLKNELKKAKGYSRQLSLAMVDIDNFKYFNDKYDRIKGNKALIHIAQVLKKNIRDTDFVARFGGEKFVILFPETGNPVAVSVLERIRNAIEMESFHLKGRGKTKLTVSIGVATYPINAETQNELIQSADKALQGAKLRGKNRVETI